MTKLWFAALAVLSFAGTAYATNCVTVHMGRWTRTTCDDGSTQTTTHLGRYNYTALEADPEAKPPVKGRRNDPPADC